MFRISLIHHSWFWSWFLLSLKFPEFSFLISFLGSQSLQLFYTHLFPVREEPRYTYEMALRKIGKLGSTYASSKNKCYSGGGIACNLTIGTRKYSITSIRDEEKSPEQGGNNSINLFTAINQALHIALETDARWSFHSFFPTLLLLFALLCCEDGG